MHLRYALFLHSEAVAIYRSMRGRERVELERFFESLENYPYLEGETTERDVIGRTVQVKFVGKFKLVYWADHAVKEVKLLKLERLRKW